jgi:branched-subunit amino acid aminotransferase/4-amino-4-deoxychorismate lyase
LSEYIFLNGQLSPLTHEGELLVADSFLVKDGKVRSLNLHIDRFLRGAALKAPTVKDRIEDFLAKSLALIPKTGSYFPRIEIQRIPEPVLVFKLRPAPELLKTAILWSYPEADPRQDLSTKGPELLLGAELRSKAIANGADEAILLNQDGKISEGALSSLVWWREGVLCAPEDDIPWLESVTRQEIFEIAISLGIETRLEHSEPKDLVGLELWLLSSLHGIRVVTSWVGVSAEFSEGNHVAEFELRMSLLESNLS